MNTTRQIFLNLALAASIPLLSQTAPGQTDVLPQPSRKLLKPVVARNGEGLLDQSNPNFAFRRTENNPAIVFGSLGEQYQHHPVIFVFLEGSWQLVELADAAFYANDWIQVAKYGSFVWGITEYGNEGPGWNLEIVLSRDGGRSWRHVARLRKPGFLAEFRSFQMGPGGAGTLTVYLNEDYESHKRGLYTYRTSDWGRQWTRPQYAADLLKPPDYGRDVSSERSILESKQELIQKLPTSR